MESIIAVDVGFQTCLLSTCDGGMRMIVGGLAGIFAPLAGSQPGHAGALRPLASMPAMLSSSCMTPKAIVAVMADEG